MGSFPPGTPCWAELGSPSPAESARFYGQLFGWAAEVDPTPGTGGYTTFRLAGDAVAAVGPLQGEGQPATWTTYFATDDAVRLADAVRAAGGTLVVEPMDVMGYGRMLIFHDPAGAVAGAWQAGSMGGADVVGEPGSVGWNELTTRDVDGSKAFYGAVLGWRARDVPYDGVRYTLWEIDDRAVAGMMPMVGDDWPPDLPPHWMVYFSVADTDATAARVRELGGSVSVPPTDTPAGRLAVLGDAHGASFSVVTPDPSFNP